MLFIKQFITAILALLFFLSNTNSYCLEASPINFYLNQTTPSGHAYNPPLLKGIKINPNDPLTFNFILDRGEDLSNDDYLKTESMPLLKYFLASLTIPEQDLWVNLSPYEHDRIIPNAFGKTLMGRDLLLEDYFLKQLTASVIYPTSTIGKQFWKQIYQEAKTKFGRSDIPMHSFNKVWIIPDTAIIDEYKNTAVIVKATLKVMLDADYLSRGKHQETHNDISLQLTRELVLPQLTREINENKQFAQLRQIYHALILAVWYKHKMAQSLLTQIYVHKNKTTGIEFPAISINHKPILNPTLIYQRYLESFKKGVYDYISEDVDPATEQVLPRRYFSGGALFTQLSMDKAILAKKVSKPAINAEVSPTNLDLEMSLLPSQAPTDKIKTPMLKKIAKGLLSTAFMGAVSLLPGDNHFSPSVERILTPEFFIGATASPGQNITTYEDMTWDDASVDRTAAIIHTLYKATGKRITIATYNPLANGTDLSTVNTYLTKIYLAGGNVIIGFPNVDGRHHRSFHVNAWNDPTHPKDTYIDYIRTIKDNPAVAGYALFNEYNLWARSDPGAFGATTESEAIKNIIEEANTLARTIRTIDSNTRHKISLIWGSLPTKDQVKAAYAIDSWGINVFDMYWILTGQFFLDAKDVFGTKEFYIHEAGVPGEEMPQGIHLLIQAIEKFAPPNLKGVLFMSIMDERWKPKDEWPGGSIKIPKGKKILNVPFLGQQWGMADREGQLKPAVAEAFVEELTGHPPNEDSIDQASLAAVNPTLKGGIDFNPDQLNLTTHTDQHISPLNYNFKISQKLASALGFFPVITRIQIINTRTFFE